MSPLAVILPAAGSSRRFGRNKLVEPLGGQTVLSRALTSMWNHEDVEQIFVATSDPSIIEILKQQSQAILDSMVICPGGKTRAHSVLNALRIVPPNFEWVAVHDAARPLVTLELINNVFQAAREHGAAVPA